MHILVIGVVIILFYIYSRKSVITSKGESIDNQIEMCKEYIERKFADSPEKTFKIYEDEGFSAKNTNRPQLQQLLTDIKRERPDYLVCYRLDRISRSVSDFSALIEELNRREISFLCIREEFDTSKPMGKAMMYIASVFAQLERETIAERVRDNMLLLAKSGRWLGGNAPLGYMGIRENKIIFDGKKRSLCRLELIPKECEIVKKIFALFLSHQSIDAVRKCLLEDKIKTRNGKDFSDIALKSILTNAVYCKADHISFLYLKSLGAEICFNEHECDGIHGLITYNKRDYRKHGAPWRAVNDWIISRGEHKGLICGGDWVKVQNILKQKSKSSTRGNSYNYLLSGILYCPLCGSKMFAKRRYGRKFAFDYICSKKMQNGIASCNLANLCGADADNAVLDMLNTFCIDTEIVSAKILSVDIYGKNTYNKDIFKLDMISKKELLRRTFEKIVFDGEHIILQ